MPRSTSAITRRGNASAYARPSVLPPGTAEQHPALDAEKTADRFDITDQRCRVVAGQLTVRGRGSRTALIEQHDAVTRRIEKTAVRCLTARARTTMHEQHRDTIRIAAFLEMKLVWRIHRQTVHRIRPDFGIERQHGDRSA
jgi:hypothetical protein